MSHAFADKLGIALKVLSMSRGRLAADLNIDKSVVSRWVTGAVKPSAHNLARLTQLIATRVDGFTVLDWDRDLDGLAALLGVDPAVVRGPAPDAPPTGLPLALLPEILATTATRGASYEGFWRSTRAFADMPGAFIHDQCMIRRDANGLLRFRQGTMGVFVDGWVLPLQTQLFFIGAQLMSGSIVFAMFNGSPVSKVQCVDGIVLASTLDAGLTPTAAAAMYERVGDLTGDDEADEARFQAAALLNPLAPEGSISPQLRAHLMRDIGPEQMAIGGDLLLRMPVARSLSR